MKKPLLALLITGVSMGVYAAGDSNGRTSGRADSAYSTGDFIDGALLNPSLAANFREGDNFALNINLGGFAADPSELIDNGSDLNDLLDRYEYPRELSSLDASDISNYLDQIEGTQAYLTGGGNLALAFPNQILSATVFVRTDVKAGVLPSIDEQDHNTLSTQTAERFQSSELNSEVAVRGSMVTEVGIALAQTYHFTETGHWLLGVTPKQVRAETFYYVDKLGTFDEDNIDKDEQTIDKTFFSMDAGVTYIKGNARYAMIINNLIGQNIDSLAPSEQLTIERQVVAAAGFRLPWVDLDGAVELTGARQFALANDTQIARVGAVFGPQSWARLRLGYKTDLQDTLEDTYSLGLGLAPFDAVNLDLSVTSGKDNTYGASAQLGVRF
ncbi:conjugal transfer protein TraF [Gilvimarinus agarilyticus]|uniref:conjugal transfer protein TraF n=1 Tax=Gilvimarinus sp. 2_MG-2023 TaxID=3062666 RepID=UPI001C095729|nr:conjugal transfer protein TraF [Gilvimarinus sp. 2_MG-2023]MBU2884147.1 conjugal transfer protein TraF [Gilvimarinus agarilyticus]MDO6569319.1 conjugal transfer protein TraF [Gilvimarinus sp. 2_MG-2023]